MPKQKEWTTMEFAYIAKFHSIDGPESLAASFDVTVDMISHVVRRMKKNDEYEIFAEVWDRYTMRGGDKDGIHNRL